jgi:hypothetical protein
MTPQSGFQKSYAHRYAIVGNPGCPWDFGEVLFRGGVLEVVRKSKGSPFLVLLHFYYQIF